MDDPKIKERKKKKKKKNLSEKNRAYYPIFESG